MVMNDIKYSDIRAQLTGTDGNAYSIIGRVGRALEDTGVRTDIERVGRVEPLIAQMPVRPQTPLLKTKRT